MSLRDGERFRILTLGLSLLLGLTLAGTGSAASLYIDVDPVFQQLSAGESASGSFDIVNPGNDCFLLLCDQGGFTPGSEQVIGARMSFVFFDLDWGQEEAVILLGDISNPLQTDGFQQHIFIIHFESFDANVQVLTQLNANGQLDWTVYAPTSPAPATGYHDDSENDVYLKVAKLKAVSAIPEPSGVALFGLGSLLVGHAIRRRRAS